MKASLPWKLRKGPWALVFPAPSQRLDEFTCPTFRDFSLAQFLEHVSKQQLLMFTLGPICSASEAALCVPLLATTESSPPARTC